MTDGRTTTYSERERESLIHAYATTTVVTLITCVSNTVKKAQRQLTVFAVSACNTSDTGTLV